jgi:hypothetical protein
MTTTTVDYPHITCGHCQNTHHSVSEVRACYGLGDQPRIPSPRIERPADVPAGRYAIERIGQIEFYRVDRPDEGRWRGYTFVTRQAGDNEFAVRNRQSREDVLTVIGRDPRAAMLRYGQEIGACGHCGRTLTNPESRAAGIGPICSRKMGF